MHHQESPARPPVAIKRSASSEALDQLAPPSDSAPLASSSSGPPRKKITRRRQILSCRNCTSRKIRCEREGGPGTPCKACEKRGESQLCDAGSYPAASGSSPAIVPLHSSESCQDHRNELERRVAALEAAVLSNRYSRSGESSNGEPSHHAAVQEAPDSETEDAAMTLEDIAVNVRIAPTTRQAPTNSLPPTPYAPAPPPIPPASRESASLLVPPISNRYRGVLADLYETLPDRLKVDWLVGHYLSSVSWFWVAHHGPTFLAEYHAFHALRQEGRQYEICPLWLAILFLTLAHSANSLDYLPPGSPFTPDELAGLVPAYFEAARAALDCGDAFGAAKLRTIQAVVLLAPLSLNSGNPARVDILIPYVAAAVRLCQQLGLDKLGNDPAVMPPPDPALPDGINSLRREMALRIFHALLHVDQTIFRCRPVLPLHLVECAMPSNLDDKDLSPTSLVSPHPPAVRTIAAYEVLRFRVGAVQRQFHEQIILDPNYQYSTVLKHDTELRNLLAEYDLERPEPGETTVQFWARVFSLQNVNIRLIRFHRPFMSRGYREPTYRKSTDAALAAARVVLETQKELDRTNAPLVKDCYQLNHIQVAIVCLFLDIWQNHDPDGAQPTADYRLVSDVSLCFHRALGSCRERVRVVARQSLLVIQCLFEALHARTATGRKEPFAQLLKRVSVAISEAERRAALQDSSSSGAPGSSSSNGAALARPPTAPAPLLPGAPVPPFYSGTPVNLPQGDPVSADGRSLLLDVPAPGYALPGGIPFAAAPGSAHGSTPSFSPGELPFGDLHSEWGFSWLHDTGGYA
ncbi:hypothetical protein JCM8097_006850 [Rhodosporidiobolus ruineniae]